MYTPSPPGTPLTGLKPSAELLTSLKRASHDFNSDDDSDASDASDDTELEFPQEDSNYSLRIATDLFPASCPPRLSRETAAAPLLPPLARGAPLAAVPCKAEAGRESSSVSGSWV
eukprot:gene15612-18508_t